MIRLALAALLTLAAALATGDSTRAASALLYVTNQKTASIDVIDTGNDAPVATLAVAPGPAMIAASPSGRRLYVTHPESGQLTILDGQALKVPRVIDLTGAPFGVAASADGRVFVSDWNRNLLVVLDESGAKLAEIGVGRAPAHVVVSAASKRVFVANREGDSVSVIDTERLTVVATVGVGHAPFALAVSPGGDRLYVANAQSSDLWVFSTESLERLGAVQVGAMPYGIAVGPAGDRILVANQQSGSVFIIDAASLVVTHRVKVGRYPENVVILPNGSRAYVVNWMSGDISVLNPETGQELKRLEASDGIRGLAIVPAG